MSLRVFSRMVQCQLRARVNEFMWSLLRHLLDGGMDSQSRIKIIISIRLRTRKKLAWITFCSRGIIIRVQVCGIEFKSTVLYMWNITESTAVIMFNVLERTIKWQIQWRKATCAIRSWFLWICHNNIWRWWWFLFWQIDSHSMSNLLSIGTPNFGR